MNSTATKTCYDCKATLPLDGFNRNKRRADGRNAECRSCQSRRRNEWARNNTANRRAADQRRRAKIAAVGGHLSAADVRLARVIMPCCVKCGSTDNLALDHITPISKGGRNDIFNIQILCRSCNSAKCNYNANDYRLIPFIPLQTDRVMVRLN